jgi:hypothetical protein
MSCFDACFIFVVYKTIELGVEAGLGVIKDKRRHKDLKPWIFALAIMTWFLGVVLSIVTYTVVKARF